MIRVGIDPGVTGCIAILDEETGRVEFHDTPIILEDTPKGKLKTYDEPAIWQILKAIKEGSVVVEHQRYYGWGDNAKALATLCYGYGLFVGYANALGLPVLKVEPNVWKRKLLGSKNAHKNEAVELAQELFPAYRKQLLKSKNGRSDALLLIQYHIMIENETENV